MPKSNTEELPQIRAVDDWAPWVAGLLQLIAAVGWVLVLFGGALILGLGDSFPEGSKEREESNSLSWYITPNYAAAIIGWPACLVVAWIRYFRSTRANRKLLLLFTSLPYVHVLLFVVSCLLLALLDQYLDLGL